MTDAAEADDADFLAGAAAIPDERAVGGYAGAEHGGGIGGGELFGDGEDPERYVSEVSSLVEWLKCLPEFVGPHVRGVSSLRNDSGVRPLRAIGI